MVYIGMERKYIVLVNGVKAKERMTMKFALQDVKELQSKGYNKVSIAEKLYDNLESEDR